MAEYILTDEDKRYIDSKCEEFNYDVKRLTQGITGEDKDGRSLEGMAVKKYLVEKGAKPAVKTNDPKKYVAFQLSKEQKQFVENNAEHMSIAEMTTVLFPEIESGRGIGFTKEFKAIQKFIKIETSIVVPENEEKDKSGLPTNLTQAIVLINKVIGAEYNVNNVNDQQKDSIHKMIRHLRRGSIIYNLQEFSEDFEKDIYIESLVSDIWDKGDLTSSEVTQYADLASERVRVYQLKRNRKEIQDLISEAANNDDKIQYTWAETLEKIDKSIDNCMGRIEKLIKNLDGTRTQRLKDKPTDDITILSIIEIFKKKAERDKFLELQKKQDELLAEKLDEYETQDEYISRILGASKSEIISQQDK
jgi:copper chaperone CopZ